MTRKIVWVALIVLVAAVTACGGSTQGVTGTAPSLVSPVDGGTGSAGGFSLLKEGKGKGPDRGEHTPLPEVGTTPEPGDADVDDDADEIGEGHGHGKAAVQIEGFTNDIDGPCPGLTIHINGMTVTTVELTTEFQRTDCETILGAAGGDTPVHLHIAATKVDTALVATYVRMQGPKTDDGDDAEDEAEGTTPTRE